MALREELVREGNWLFRWRSYPPVVLLLLVIASLPAARNPDTWQHHRAWVAFCVAVSIIGELIRCVTVGHAPAGTSGRNTRGQLAEQVNTTGIYSVVRHPLYLGNFVIYMGAAMYPGLWWMAAIVALVFWLYYERIMLAEEEFLRGRYGAAYEEWAARTPPFIPRLGGWKPAALPFSLKTVLKREYAGVFGITTAYFVLHVASMAIFRRRVDVSPLWWGVFALGLVTYLVLRTLRRHTRALKVEGR
ncbi:MAG TPA: isoprenylcysteine carboxylmethyltransferase family protein [Longimicrobiaceae bacterium]|nr:isoprenylcysteine carboxylmethyltransferase family protein [Longimicrobiaceae bacterium]